VGPQKWSDNRSFVLFVKFCVTSCTSKIKGDQKVSVHLMITIQKVTRNVSKCSPPVSGHPAQSDCLAADRQRQGDTRLTLTPSIIPNSNYVIMVSD
jgi:hypothetical protein